MKKKFWMIGLTTVFMVAMTTVAYAETTVEFTNDNQLVYNTQEMGDAFKGMAPGDQKSQTLTIKNSNSHTTTFYMSAETLDYFERARAASGGLYDIQLTLQPPTGTATKLDELQEMNEDVTGWIAFDELEISYPLMHPEDNLYYLTHTFSRTENKAGSIFMDAGNTADMTDFHTIIYGHNMKNGSMFGLLKKYYDEEFYDENEFFTIYTGDKAYRYEIFSAHTVSETDEIYTIWYTPDENNVEYGAFVDQMKRTSWYDTGVDILNSDKVVTLSTCTASDDQRFVVHGKLVAMYVTE